MRSSDSAYVDAPSSGCLGRKRAIVVDQERDEEISYRRIFEATSDGLIINDPETGCVVEANSAVCRMHGYTQDEFIGLHATAFIHPDYHHVFAEFRDTIAARGTYQTQALDMRKDGSAFHVEVHGSPVRYRGRRHILAVVRDVSERVRAQELLEQRVDERTRELRTLLQVTRTVASTLELKPLLSLILDNLRSIVNYTGASISAVDGDDLVFLQSRGPKDEEYLVNRRYPRQARPQLWEALSTGSPVVIDDVRGDTPMARAYRGAVGQDIGDSGFSYVRSWMGTPLQVKDRVIGVLGVSSHQPGAFSSYHASLVMGLAQQAGGHRDRERPPLRAIATDCGAGGTPASLA